MDPNETLRLIRLTIAQMRVDTDRNVRRAHAEEIAEYFEALDEWASKGGFLPAAWTTAPKIEWSDDTRTCTVTSAGSTVTFTMDSDLPTVHLNGRFEGTLSLDPGEPEGDVEPDTRRTVFARWDTTETYTANIPIPDDLKQEDVEGYLTDERLAELETTANYAGTPDRDLAEWEL